MNRTHLFRTGVVGVVVAVGGLAACDSAVGGSGSVAPSSPARSTSAPSTPTTPVPATTTATSGGAATAPTSPAASPPPGTADPRQPGGGATPAGPDGCTSAQLQLVAGSESDQPGGGGAAGSFVTAFVFTNAGAQPCTMTGYPGVSVLTASGKRVGPTAPEDQATPRQTIALAAGGRATFSVRVSTVPGAACPDGPQHVDAISVIPPNQTVPRVVAFPQTLCALTDVTAVRTG